MNKIILYIICYSIGILAVQAQIQSKDFILKNDSIELPGTLTYTKTSKDLVIWVHGSGDVDRNGNQRSANVKANYIKQLRDSLNQQNIAFYSYDKRTSNPKNAAFHTGIVLDDFVSDVKKAVSYFKENKQFQSITLIGHSQGSLVAMLAIDGVDKYVSLAGPGESIDETLIKQISGQNAMLGETAKAHIKELKETGEIKEVNPFLVNLFAKQNQPFMRNWMNYDPVQEIKKIKIPTLIINGTKDLQVKVEDAKALKEGNPNAELVIIENMNHVLKIIEKDSDNYPSYFSPDFKIASELITSISEFVKK